MSNRIAIALVWLLAVVLGDVAGVSAEEATGGHDESAPVRTLGGKQFWADELFFHKWRIQRNVLTGHCRLLDGSDYRHDWGTFDECRRKLDEIRRQQKLPPMHGPGVLVVHGLFRTRSSMDKLCKYLEEQGGYSVFNATYPSTRRPIGGHNQALASIIEHLDGIEEIHFVAHSMGNVVLRHFFAEYPGSASEMPPPGEWSPSRTPRPRAPRFGRFVMIGPTNHGSLLANGLGKARGVDLIAGDALRQLGAGWNALQGRLATPRFEFGIIAGGKDDGKGFSPLLPGDDDGTVTVASSRLLGARDFLLLPISHTYMMDNAQVQECTLRFLKHGYFRTADERQPITDSHEANHE